MTEEKLRNSLQAGQKLHWYEIEKVLGQGGFGITYLAYDANLDQRVAIKEYLPMELAVREGNHSVYPASQAQDERYQWGLDRFLSEARTLAKFKHSAIVRVLSVFEENNTAYMVMEYQRGQSLQQILERERTLSEVDLTAMVKPMLDGLESIHAAGFIHRDIKPANIFVNDEGYPVLLDFGSARQALGEHTRTLTSVVSPGYAPFEQYYSKSDRQGPWTDIYGLGATLYRCISGLQPMAAIDRSEAILKAERDVFVPASEIGRGNYSADFLFAIDNALQFNEKKRPQTVAEWRTQFDFSISGEHMSPPGPVHTTLPEHATTRFSALAEESFDVTTGAPLINAAMPDTEISSQPVTHSEPPASGPRSAARARTEPRAATEQLAPADPRVPTTFEPLRKRRVWPLVTVLCIGAAAGAVWYFQDSGLLPQIVVTSKGGREARRLIEQGDRALAAGQIFEPYEGSAMAFYQDAYAARTDDPDAVHGLAITSERLVAAIEEAIVFDDVVTTEALAKTLARIPHEVFDSSETHSALVNARVRWAAANKQSERIDEFLQAAAEDIEQDRLLGPGTDNALAKYRAVQILEPGNPDAKTGLRNLGMHLAVRGTEALERGNTDDAVEWFEQAQMLNGEAPEVVALEGKLSQVRTKEQAEQDRETQIEKLLGAAAKDIAANRLSTPAGNNALERYRRVLKLDADHRDARRGIEQIHDRYVALATEALRSEDLVAARSALAKARNTQPNSPRVMALQQDIEGARERIDRAEAERLATMAEQQIQDAKRIREEAESIRLEAEHERKRRQEQEAARLFAEAQRKAGVETR